MKRQAALALALTIAAGVTSCASGSNATSSFHIPTRSATAARFDVDEKPWWTTSTGSKGSAPKKPQTFTVPGYILFDVDSSTLSPLAGTQLARIANIAQGPRVQVRIVGYTDSDGTVAHNRQLSRARARSVAKWLIRHGIARSRVIATGLGEGDPIAPNDTAQHKAENRRVTITIRTHP